MRSSPSDAPSRPYWLLPIAGALLLMPWGLSNLLLFAAIAGALLLPGYRALAGRKVGSVGAKESGLLLGVDARGGKLVLSDRQLSAHGLILGASGSGKSTTLLRILTEHVRWGRPVVALDMKGSPAFARELQTAAAAAGRPFCLWTPDGPGNWNPLQYGNATELKDKLIATERFTEPHYQRAAERYVQTVLQVLHEVDPARAPSLAQVVDLMEPRRVSELLRGLPAPRAQRVHDYLASLTPDQLSAVRGIGTRLAIISESHTGRYLAPGPDQSIDLRRALGGREVVCFSLNSSTYGKLSAQLGALVIQDLLATVGHRLTEAMDGAGALEEPPPAIIAIDEFSALGADNVIPLLVRGRESGASVLLATQELADLDRAAFGVRDQVVGVTAIKIAHRQEVPASAQMVAQMAGTEKVWEETYSLRRGLLGRHDSSRGTRRQVEQFVIHPNVIKTLETGEAVVITKIPTASARIIRVTPPRREGLEH